MTTTRPFVRRTQAAGLFFVSMAVLGLQVAATRLFSFMLWYHFAFLVISIAFLGFTGGGLVVHWRRSIWKEDPSRVLERTAFAGAAASLVCFFTLTRIQLEPFFLSSIPQLLLFLTLVVVMLAPFFCLGVCVCLTLSAGQATIHRLYAVNLVGSGLGCLAVVIFLEYLGVSASFLTAAFLVWLGAICFGAGRAFTARGLFWRALASAGWIVLIGLATDELHPLVHTESTKMYPRIPRERILKRESDSLASVDFFETNEQYAVWGLSPSFRGEIPQQISVVIDAWALTSIYRRDQVERPDSIIDYLPAGLAHRLRSVDDVLVIGCGGGIDILTALYYGAQSVTGIDINPLIVDSVRHDYADFAGHLYDDPRVSVHVSEGRHFLKRSDETYDLIQLSGVDTYSASQAGAFALHENYLYTTEALHDYLDALRPGGILTLTRWIYYPPRQTLKLVAMIDQVLRERGIAEPKNHVSIITSGPFSVVILQTEPLTREQVAQIVDEAGQKEYDVVYVPYATANPSKRFVENAFYEYFEVGADRFVDEYMFDIRPSRDDRPFFFEHYRWSDMFRRDPLFRRQHGQSVLLVTLLITGFFCALMLYAARRFGRGMPSQLGVSGHIYFVGLGLGFILVENVLVQRIILYLGSPAYALSVILFTLLVFSGIGSGLAGRFPELRKHARWVLLAIAGLLALYAAALTPLLEGVLAASLPMRITVVTALIAPVALLMGMPFPIGIERIGAADERLVPWAWVVNGAASVLGSVLTVMVAITWGFTAVVVSALLLYGIAGWAWGSLVTSASPADN